MLTPMAWVASKQGKIRSKRCLGVKRGRTRMIRFLAGRKGFFDDDRTLASLEGCPWALEWLDFEGCEASINRNDGCLPNPILILDVWETKLGDEYAAAMKEIGAGLSWIDLLAQRICAPIRRRIATERLQNDLRFFPPTHLHVVAFLRQLCICIAGDSWLTALLACGWFHGSRDPSLLSLRNSCDRNCLLLHAKTTCKYTRKRTFSKQTKATMVRQTNKSWELPWLGANNNNNNLAETEKKA